MSWTPGDVSGSQTLTNQDHLYNTHINELRTASDSKLAGAASSDNLGLVNYSGTTGKVAGSVIGGPVMDNNGRIILKNTNQDTALLLNNITLSGARAPLANEILFQPQSAAGVFDSTYGYGVMSWYCDDTSLKDVIMQAHHHLDSDATNDHHHFSLYTSNSARDSTIKRFNVQYRQDYALMDFQNTYITISNVGTNNALEIDMNHDAAPGDALFIRDVSGGRTYHVTKDAQQSFIGLFAADSATRYAVTGDATARAIVKMDGSLQWGNGTAATDTFLSRTGVGTLALGSGNALQLQDGNIILGTTTGTKIGTLGGASGQKLGFYNATPIVQPLLATGAAHTVDDVITTLQNLGLVRQS